MNQKFPMDFHKIHDLIPPLKNSIFISPVSQHFLLQSIIFCTVKAYATTCWQFKTSNRHIIDMDQNGQAYGPYKVAKVELRVFQCGRLTYSQLVLSTRLQRQVQPFLLLLNIFEILKCLPWLAFCLDGIVGENLKHRSAYKMRVDLGEVGLPLQAR